MQTKEYEIMFMVEEFHWWYQGMASITRRIIEKYCPSGPDYRILDAGCGTGGGILLLSQYGSVCGIDISKEAIHFSHGRGFHKLMRASVMALPFHNASFDLLTSFDILYFKGINDTLALQEAARVLTPEGRILVRVPAFNWLRGIHDKKVSTGHRYTLQEICMKIERNGFIVEFANYMNTILFPLAVLKRSIEKWLPPQADSDLAIPVGPLSFLLRGCLILESHFITKCRFPFGLSIIVMGKKR